MGGADADRARRVHRELLDQIDDYLLPRLRALDAPVLVVVGGSTGSGKSTLVNSLVGHGVSPAGVIRPTTRTPVLVCHPSEQRWFLDERVLPGLTRVTGGESDARCLRIVADAGVGPGLALLDAPDIDSVVAENRELAAELLAAADVWLFLTTAARYADAVPWDLLHRARQRSTSLCVVLNRVPDEALQEVPKDLGRMLEAQGLGDAVVLVIPEGRMVDGLMPGPLVAPVRAWVDALVESSEARARLVRRTLSGAIASIPPRVGDICDVLDAQERALDDMRNQVLTSYGGARSHSRDGLSAGSLLRGEVLARWQEFLGTGDVMRTLESKIGQLRGRLRNLITGEPYAATEVRAAVSDSVTTLVMGACESAAEEVVDAWASGPGAPLLQGRADELRRPSPGLRDEVLSAVRAWQRGVLELVASQGGSKRALGRALSFGINALGSSLMIVVFAHTGGLTGGELVVAGGTAALSQKILEAVFGDQAVRDLTERARRDLLARIDQLLTSERSRFFEVTDDPSRAVGASGLREAAIEVGRGAAV